MLFILQALQNSIYAVRNYLWSFPEFIFVGNSSPVQRLSDLYRESRPFSHFFVIIFITVVLVSLIAQEVNAFFRINTNTFIEGVIVGVDNNGQLRQLNRISPLIVSEIQLEKDLGEIIYESLIKVDQQGNINNVLIENYESLDEGSRYRFKLLPDVYWHDGELLTSKDVEATFKLLQQLENSAETSTLYSRAAVNLKITIIDDLTFDFSFKENTVIPSFFEAISFKILPAHMLDDLNPQNINSSDPIINRNPVGTGPYRLQRVESKSITLRENSRYRKPVSLQLLKFDLFPNEISAVNAIKSGQIHGLAGVSIDSLRDLKDNAATEIMTSQVIFNQYWGLYFNLGDPLFAEKKLRQAIASAVNKSLIIDALLGYAEESNSSIPPISFAYADVNRFTYDINKARELLDELGWTLTAGKSIREKDGKQLEFELLYVDNVDRGKIAEVIKQDLAEVGINVVIRPESLAKVRDEHVIPKQFSSLLFGVQTFIDPDRYELFHSSQINHPGLNISSYRSSREVLAVVPDPEKPGRVVTKKIPEIDDILDDARKITNVESRKEKYKRFQEILAEDVPVVFLYHPKETYIINKRVKNVDISKINYLEERFDSVEDWQISIK